METLSQITGRPFEAISASIKGPQDLLNLDAQRIFCQYALSPADFSEATRRYVELCTERNAISEKAAFEDLVYEVLYSLNCENVWHRSSWRETLQDA